MTRSNTGRFHADHALMREGQWRRIVRVTHSLASPPLRTDSLSQQDAPADPGGQREIFVLDFETNISPASPRAAELGVGCASQQRKSTSSFGNANAEFLMR